MILNPERIRKAGYRQAFSPIPTELQKQRAKVVKICHQYLLSPLTTFSGLTLMQGHGKPGLVLTKELQLTLGAVFDSRCLVHSLLHITRKVVHVFAEHSQGRLPLDHYPIGFYAVANLHYVAPTVERSEVSAGRTIALPVNV